MNKRLIIIVIGILMMIAGLVGATMKVNTTWHYFGNGAVFGIGISLLVMGLLFWKSS